MQDVTSEVLKQSEDYGRKANLNINRIGIYRNKVRSIYRYLGKKRMTVVFMEGDSVIGFRVAKAWAAMQLVSAFGERFFLDIVFTSTGDTIIVRLTGEAPAPRKEDIEEQAKCS